MRGETKPEDKIVGVVLARLKKQLGFTFDEMEAETGIPRTTLSTVTHSLTALGNPGRIPVIASYFQNVHGLDYVTERYLLTGGPEDQARIELLKREAAITAEEFERQTRPPFFELAI